MQTLRTTYLNVAGKNTRLYYELAKVLKVLQNEEIPVILLKGAHLAEVVYESIALRTMCDVDILVRKTDLLKAEKKLLEMGYSSSRVEEIEVVCAKCQHLSPLAKQGVAPVEIHWTIESPTSPFTIDVDGLWKRAQPATIAGVKVLALSPEDLLLHLCLHSAYHHFFEQGLRSLCDILETIRYYRNQIDWTLVEHRASQWNAKNPVYLTLRLARELLAAEVPDELLNALKPKKIDERLMVCANEQIFTKGNDTANTLHWGSLKGLLPERQGKSFWGISMPRTLSPTTIAQRYKLPQNSWRIYLYYPIRLTDLFLRYRLLQLLYHHEERMKLSNQFALLKWLES
ncbi:hypothetical protein THIOM_001076 [Candidatus Thiomargarita nelsonii]|uniref:Nucleotidyltransferase family protein n=1 Tax=Candidatus Thiomargarita nelsonii TaxID=1003181 RepID=A0A176S564_9GAMM|nr:hypothetical protein THIOM_001076 [Candidatus Thiomargarita nelsonii]